MTILEALTAAIQIPAIDTATLEKACIDAEIFPTSTYAKSNEAAVDQAAVGVLKTLVVMSESEGGFSYNLSPEALQQRIAGLEVKLGIASSTQPKVRSVNVW